MRTLPTITAHMLNVMDATPQGAGSSVPSVVCQRSTNDCDIYTRTGERRIRSALRTPAAPRPAHSTTLCSCSTWCRCVPDGIRVRFAASKRQMRGCDHLSHHAVLHSKIYLFAPPSCVARKSQKHCEHHLSGGHQHRGHTNLLHLWHTRFASCASHISQGRSGGVFFLGGMLSRGARTAGNSGAAQQCDDNNKEHNRSRDFEPQNHRTNVLQQKTSRGANSRQHTTTPRTAPFRVGKSNGNACVYCTTV